MAAKKIPGDFGVVALSLEARKQGTSYGKLVAATTLEEREIIVERWRERLYGRYGDGRRRRR